MEEVGDDEDDANPMATDEAIQAHEEALTTLTEQGRKRPRKKHTPMMEIVLSPRRVNLTIDDGWTLVPFTYFFQRSLTKFTRLAFSNPNLS